MVYGIKAEDSRGLSVWCRVFSVECLVLVFRLPEPENPSTWSALAPVKVVGFLQPPVDAGEPRGARRAQLPELLCRRLCAHMRTSHSLLIPHLSPGPSKGRSQSLSPTQIKPAAGRAPPPASPRLATRLALTFVQHCPLYQPPPLPAVSGWSSWESWHCLLLSRIPRHAPAVLAPSAAAVKRSQTGPEAALPHMENAYVLLWHPGPSPGASRLAPTRHKAGRSVPCARRMAEVGTPGWPRLARLPLPTFCPACSQSGQNPSAPIPFRTLATHRPAWEKLPVISRTDTDVTMTLQRT